MVLSSLFQLFEQSDLYLLVLVLLFHSPEVWGSILTPGLMTRSSLMTPFRH